MSVALELLISTLADERKRIYDVGASAMKAQDGDTALAVINFAKKLEDFQEFALPSEAQWEYACKAGKNSDFNNGENLSDKRNCKGSDPISWNKLNSKGKTHIVGQKKANSWGLYDMHGNVFLHVFLW